MLFGWFDAREAKDFGAALARFYMERIPPVAGTEKRPRTGRREEVLAQMSRQISQFRHGHKMNFYKKAQFGNAFRWTLVDAGYDPGEAAETTRFLLFRF